MKAKSLTVILLSALTSAFGDKEGNLWDLVLNPYEETNISPSKQAKSEKRAYHKLESSDVIEELRAAIQAHLKIEDELKIKVLNTLPKISTRVENWQLELINPPAQLKRKLYLNFNIICEGKVAYKSKKMPVSCSIEKEILFSKLNLAKNDNLSNKNFVVKKKNILEFYDKELVEQEVDLKKFVLKKAIKKNTPLTWDLLNCRPDIKKNQIVEVVANKGQLHINIRAKALENGAINQTIQMQNLSSQKTFLAKIINEHKAIVEL